MSHYTVGTSNEGADVYPIEFEDYSIRAYPPLLLFKCLLLQKWFRPSTIFRTYGININSDPELENQINDRLSFKNILGTVFQ
jgi:IS5 family transposase